MEYYFGDKVIITNGFYKGVVGFITNTRIRKGHTVYTVEGVKTLGHITKEFVLKDMYPTQFKYYD